MDFLHLNGLRPFRGWVDLVLNGELGKGKLVCHDDVLLWSVLGDSRCDVGGEMDKRNHRNGFLQLEKGW